MSLSGVVGLLRGRPVHPVGPDGRIYVLTHDFSSEPLPDFGNLQSPRIDDFLVVLSPEGRELEKIPLIEPVASSPYRHLLHTVSSYSTGDPLHTNDVDFITTEAARNFPFGRPGQVPQHLRSRTGSAWQIELDAAATEFVIVCSLVKRRPWRRAPFVRNGASGA